MENNRYRKINRRNSEKESRKKVGRGRITRQEMKRFEDIIIIVKMN